MFSMVMSSQPPFFFPALFHLRKIDSGVRSHIFHLEPLLFFFKRRRSCSSYPARETLIVRTIKLEVKLYLDCCDSLAN